MVASELNHASLWFKRGKEAPAFHSDYSFFWAGIWREWVQVHEWHPRGRRKKTFHPFVLITSVSLFLELYFSHSNACHTDISNLGIQSCVLSIHPCTQITATGRETKTLIVHMNKQTDRDKIHLIFWIIIIIIIIIIITLFESQIILAEHECCTNWGDCKSNKSNQIKCWFLRRGENRSSRRKTSRSRVENQQTQPTYDAGSGNRTRDTLVEGERSHHYTNPAPLKQKFPPLWIIAVEVICSLHCCHFRCTNLYNKNSSV